MANSAPVLVGINAGRDVTHAAKRTNGRCYWINCRKNRGWEMGTRFELVATRLEETVLHFFSPNGLLTAVVLILLSVVLFSGSGIERRVMDNQPAGYQQTAVSPILDTIR
jgi:hypothetical protein